MTSFIHVEQPATHPGVVRAEAFIERVRSMRLDGARGLAALLLAAIVSSLLVVADKLMSTTDDGGLLVAWVGLWAVAFVSLAFFAAPARRFAAGIVAASRSASRRRAAARADEQFMAYAQQDPRILSDLQAIITRQESLTEAATPVVTATQKSLEIVAQRSTDAQIPTLYEAMRRVNLGKYY
jgi:hypothetical protein